MRHPTPEGSESVNWERLTEEYFGEVQRLRAALEMIERESTDDLIRALARDAIAGTR